MMKKKSEAATTALPIEVWNNYFMPGRLLYSKFID
jgi:hypothetical protein